MKRAQLQVGRGIGTACFPAEPREGADFWGWVCEWEDDWTSDKSLTLGEVLSWVYGFAWTGDLPETQRHAEEGVLQVVSETLGQEDADTR